MAPPCRENTPDMAHMLHTFLKWRGHYFARCPPPHALCKRQTANIARWAHTRPLLIVRPPKAPFQKIPQHLDSAPSNIEATTGIRHAHPTSWSPNGPTEGQTNSPSPGFEPPCRRLSMRPEGSAWSTWCCRVPLLGNGHNRCPDANL